MSNLFKKAVKAESKLRLCVAGPSGAGKTYTSLKFAQALTEQERFAVIDTENGSASKYADEFEFDVLNVEPPYKIEKAAEYLQAAEEAWYDVVVLDSATHFYKGDGGLLSYVQDLANTKYSGNSYAAWNEGSQKYNQFLEAFKQSNIHVIVTARTKTKYVEGNRKGRMVKVGMEVEMRDGFEYEFDVFAQMAIENNSAHFEKSRCSDLQGEIYQKPGAEVIEVLRSWLSGARVVDGETVPDEFEEYSDGVVRFVRRIRKDLGREGESGYTSAAIDLISPHINGNAEQVAYFLSDDAEWDEDTYEKLERFLEEHEQRVQERLLEIDTQLRELAQANGKVEV